MTLIAIVGATPGHAGAGEPALTTSAQSSASVETRGDLVTVQRVNRTFDLAGPDIVGRKAEERLLLRKAVETTEVIGDKGMEGRVLVSAWPLGTDPDDAAPLYTIAASGRDGRVIDNDVYVVERGLEEIEWQSVYSLADGSKLFDATVPWLLATSGGYWNERRYLALAQVFDDTDDAALRRDDAVALLTYTSRTQVLDQVLVRADKPDRARFLRSVWDQTIKLGWRDEGAKSASPDGSTPDPKSGRLAVTIAFSPDGATLQIPVGDKGFELEKAKLAKGLSLEKFPPNLLIGRWKVSGATPAPWLAEGTDIAATVALLMNKIVDARASRIASDSPLACGHATYETNLVPPPGLFQGGLDEAKAGELARGLGLSPEATRSISLTCDTGIYEFHLPEPNLALIAFDNVIFTLSRQP